MPGPAVGVVSFYILSSLANALISSINGRKQRKLSVETTERTIAAQRENLEKQQQFQRGMQTRGYDMNSWPLDMAPDSIVDMINDSGLINRPLYLVIAPVSGSGIQKQLESIWDNISEFLTSTFQTNSSRPVILGKYRNGFSAKPIHDYMLIWNSLKDIPTLYIAPFSTDQDCVLGFTMAFWGICGMPPAVQTFEIDIRKLYIDENREETRTFKEKCDRGILKASEFPQMNNNVAIFESEKEKFAAGEGFSYLDQSLNFYQKVSATKAVYKSIAGKITPILKALLSYIADMYFVLEHETAPLFPEIVCNETMKNIPDLKMLGLYGVNTDLMGNNFINTIYNSYLTIVAENVDPVAGVETCLPAFHDDTFEQKLAARCLPSDVAVQDYSDEKKAFLRRIARIPEIKNTKYFSKIIAQYAPDSDPDYSPDASFEQAMEYLKKKRYSDAVPLLESSAANNNVSALYWLGVCCLNGKGISPDKEKAEALFRRAADMGADGACIQLYYLLKDSDPVSALQYLKSAVDRNNRIALYLMGTIFESVNNTKTAKLFYQRAAKLGYAVAIKKLQ